MRVWPLRTLAVTLLALLTLATAAWPKVTITGPSQLDVKEADLLAIDGIGPADYGKSVIRVYPETKDLQVFPLKTFADQIVLYVKGLKPGEFAIILDVNIPGQYDLVIHELTIGKGKPEPDPIPPPVPGDLSVVAVYETLDRSPEETAVLIGLRSYLKQEKIWFQYADQHRKDAVTKETPKWFRPFLEAVKKEAKALPVLVIGKTVNGVFSAAGVEPMPQTTAGAIAIVKKYGG